MSEAQGKEGWHERLPLRALPLWQVVAIAGGLRLVLGSLIARTAVAERRAEWIAERAEYTAAFREALIARLRGEDVAIADGPVEAKLVDDHEPS